MEIKQLLTDRHDWGRSDPHRFCTGRHCYLVLFNISGGRIPSVAVLDVSVSDTARWWYTVELQQSELETLLTHAPSFDPPPPNLSVRVFISFASHLNFPDVNVCTGVPTPAISVCALQLLLILLHILKGFGSEPIWAHLLITFSIHRSRILLRLSGPCR